MPGWLVSLLEIQTPLLLLTILRLVVGIEFAAQGYQKVEQGYVRKAREQIEGQPHPLEVTLQFWMEEETPIYTSGPDGSRPRRTIRMFPWYAEFLNHAVISHINVLAVVITVAELALGVLLILGLLTRVAAVAGVLLVINYLLATWHLGLPYTTLNVLTIAVLLVVGIAAAGRCLGLDQWLHERLPEIPFF